jgi:hypothetical protein
VSLYFHFHVATQRDRDSEGLGDHE